MAKPSVFISSTYYDLKTVRADLERFMKERGFEPVLHERGSVPYGTEKKLEEYCYKEIEQCDILVSLIGGHYGSQSREQDHSISQQELKTAIDQGKQVYIFVEKNVLYEHRTYDKNRENKDFKPAAVDDLRIYKFLDEVFNLSVNNQVVPFETSSDIISYLQEQWASLFQRLLDESSRQKEVLLLENMREMISTLKQLVTFLSSEKTKGDQAIRDILTTNHPIFSQLKKTLKIPYRIFFTNLEEFNAWIENRGFVKTEESSSEESNFLIWISDRETLQLVLKIEKKIFDERDGKLRIFTPEEWDSELVVLERRKLPIPPPPDEDVPF